MKRYLFYIFGGLTLLSCNFENVRAEHSENVLSKDQKVKVEYLVPQKSGPFVEHFLRITEVGRYRVFVDFHDVEGRAISIPKELNGVIQLSSINSTNKIQIRINHWKSDRPTNSVLADTFIIESKFIEQTYKLEFLELNTPEFCNEEGCSLTLRFAKFDIKV